MSAHTPGPWSAHARTVTAPETDDRLELRVQINGGNRDDNRANARLIAAAPELLAALKALVNAADNLDPQSGVPIGYQQLLDAAIAADAAIAKATGAAS